MRISTIPFLFVGRRTTTAFLAAQSLNDPTRYHRTSFGAAINGSLRNVEVVSVTPNPTGTDVAVLFLKPGRRPSECGNAAAVVRRNRGQTLSQSQMDELFGS